MSESSQTTGVERRLNLSPTIEAIGDHLETRGPVSAVALATDILERHSEYAGQKASALVLEEASADQKRPVQEWLQSVRDLYDPSRAPELHGRLVIIGLSLLEPNLLQQLQKDGFLVALQRELKEPLEALLSEQGRTLREPSDSVPIQPDDPLRQIVEDQIGRAACARFLAARIAALADQKQAYSIHLYAPWGAGKSTVLNFLREELEKDKKWRVVEFNAWQHQHIRPPWWSLMDCVFQQSKRELNPWGQLGEYWWRLSSGRLHYVIAAVALMWIIAFAVSLFPTDSSSMTDTMKFWAAIADSASKILAAIVTIWAVVQATSRSLLFGSARAAQTYTELASDPMNGITRRFNTLIQRLAPKRVAIFIDDLDRCRSSYVIELLEGIQTLFREAPVVFVIAADRRWLNACFEQAYKDLTPWVHEPGKPLGALFLEEAFQFSTSVPGIAEPLKRAFWLELIRVTSEEAQSKMEEARQKAQAMMPQIQSEGEAMRAVAQSHNQSFYDQQAIREAAVLRLAAPEVMARMEHTLKPLVPLLEPNPRGMKRLVNTYSVNRALSILSYVDIGQAQLALWTILLLRWPRLAEYLEEQPEMAEVLGQQNVSSVPEELRALFSDGDVIKVVKGGPTGVPLDAYTIRQCALIHA